MLQHLRESEWVVFLTLPRVGCAHFGDGIKIIVVQQDIFIASGTKSLSPINDESWLDIAVCVRNVEDGSVYTN